VDVREVTERASVMAGEVPRALAMRLRELEAEPASPQRLGGQRTDPACLGLRSGCVQLLHRHGAGAAELELGSEEEAHWSGPDDDHISIHDRLLN
jgi:hypothetical protein